MTNAFCVVPPTGGAQPLTALNRKPTTRERLDTALERFEWALALLYASADSWREDDPQRKVDAARGIAASINDGLSALGDTPVDPGKYGARNANRGRLAALCLIESAAQLLPLAAAAPRQHIGS